MHLDLGFWLSKHLVRGPTSNVCNGLSRSRRSPISPVWRRKLTSPECSVRLESAMSRYKLSQHMYVAG
jgi:hypothetical protein